MPLSERGSVDDTGKQALRVNPPVPVGSNWQQVPPHGKRCANAVITSRIMGDRLVAGVTSAPTLGVSQRTAGGPALACTARAVQEGRRSRPHAITGAPAGTSPGPATAVREATWAPRAGRIARKRRRPALAGLGEGAALFWCRRLVPFAIVLHTEHQVPAGVFSGHDAPRHARLVPVHGQVVQPPMPDQVSVMPVELNLPTGVAVGVCPSREAPPCQRYLVQSCPRA